jgi:hypothetical protein
MLSQVFDYLLLIVINASNFHGLYLCSASSTRRSFAASDTPCQSHRLTINSKYLISVWRLSLNNSCSANSAFVIPIYPLLYFGIFCLCEFTAIMIFFQRIKGCHRHQAKPKPVLRHRFVFA